MLQTHDARYFRKKNLSGLIMLGFFFIYLIGSNLFLHFTIKSTVNKFIFNE
jgi:hypothetical protein